MAALNEAYGVLSDTSARTRYDLSLGRRIARVRDRPATPPARGRGSLQPERFPDWYVFLGVRPNANNAEILAAARVLAAQVSAAQYTPEVEGRLLAQVRNASHWLTAPVLRAIYDNAWEGRPPRPGEHAHLHYSFYTFLGVPQGASYERIADRVTALSGKMRPGSLEERDLARAWKTLRDPAARAAYDERLADGEHTP
jgi:curved DNA-binding protein CbpA